MSKLNFILTAVAALLLAGSPLAAQVTSPIRPAQQAVTPPPNTSGEVYGGYMIGIGDILDVHVNDEDAVTGRYQVDQNGKLQVPLLTNPIPAAGATTFELSQRLSEAFKKQQILRYPSVTVLIVRGMTQNASVLGAVMRPGSYPLEKASTTVMDLISQAGGLAPNAGNVVTVSHLGESAEPHIANASLKPADTADAVLERLNRHVGRQAS